MLDRIARNPLALAGGFVLAGLIGAALVLVLQAAVPGLGKRAEIERVVKGYILTHPEVLLESVDKLRAQEAAKAETEQTALAQKALASIGSRVSSPYAGAWTGNPDGDVTVVAFMDYACGYCRASLPAIDELLKRDPNVRIVYREIPVLGPESAVGARWALAAAEQGKFKRFHDALFASDGPSDANIAAAAKVAGLDLGRAAASIKSKAVTDEIAFNHDLGVKLGMTGTPAWVIGGKYVLYGMRDYDALAAAVAEARKGG